MSELSKELVQNLLVLLFSNLEALFPAAILGKQLKARQITTLNDLRDLVAGNVRLLFALLNFLHEDLLHFHGSHLLSALHSSVPLLYFEVGIDSFVVHQHRLKDFSCRVKFLDVK